MINQIKEENLTFVTSSFFFFFPIGTVRKRQPNAWKVKKEPFKQEG